MEFYFYAVHTAFLEDILFCCPILSRTTGQELISFIEDFMHEQNAGWSKRTTICNNGAILMAGKNGGLATCTKATEAETEWANYSIHQETLCAKHTKQWKFLLCLKYDHYNTSQHNTILLHTAVTWLSYFLQELWSTITNAKLSLITPKLEK